MHYHEIYDFNSDGYAMVGKAKSGSMIPQNMEAEAKKALVEIMKEASGFEETSEIVFIISTLDKELFKKHLSELNGPSMTIADLQMLPSNKGFDSSDFMFDYYEDRSYTITLNDVKKHVENLMSSNDNFQNSVSDFWDKFQDKYEKYKKESDESATAGEIFNSILNNKAS